MPLGDTQNLALPFPSLSVTKMVTCELLRGNVLRCTVVKCYATDLRKDTTFLKVNLQNINQRGGRTRFIFSIYLIVVSNKSFSQACIVFVRKHAINIQLQILRRYIYSIEPFQIGHGTIFKNKTEEIMKVGIPIMEIKQKELSTKSCRLFVKVWIILLSAYRVASLKLTSRLNIFLQFLVTSCDVSEKKMVNTFKRRSRISVSRFKIIKNFFTT